MASPPSALVRLQESLDRGNSTPAGLFTKDPQNHPQAPGPPRKEGMFCGPCSQSTHTITLYSTLPIN